MTAAIRLKESLQRIPSLKKLLSESTSSILAEIRDTMEEMPDIVMLIEKSIRDTPPLALKEGGIIKPGYNPELDELHEIKTSGKDWITRLEADERANTGINSLKVKYNKVFGYEAHQFLLSLEQTSSVELRCILATH